MHTGHCDVVILRFSTSKTKLCVSPSGSFPMLFHPCSCLTSVFEDLSLPTFSASCALPPSQLVIGTCRVSFSRWYKPVPSHSTSHACHLKSISSPRCKLVPHQRQNHLQSFIQCLHTMVPPEDVLFVKLTCFKPYRSMFRKKFCPSSLIQELYFQGCSNLDQSLFLRHDFFLLPDNKGRQCLLMPFPPVCQDPF